jgi:hypothetical protein
MQQLLIKKRAENAIYRVAQYVASQYFPSTGSTLSTKKMEDRAFIAALKEAGQSGKGSLKKVKDHLAKVMAA